MLAPLLGAGCALWMSGTMPPRHPLTPIGAIGWAVQSVLTSWVVAAAILTGGFDRTWPRRQSDEIWLAFRASMAAVWLAPLYVLIVARSPWAVVAAALFFGGMAANLRRCRTESTETEEDYTPPLVIHPMPQGSWPVVSMWAGLMAQTAAIAVVAEREIAGVVLGGSVAAIVAWELAPVPWSEWPARLWRARAVLAVAGVAATVLTMAGLTRYVVGPRGAPELATRARKLTPPKPGMPKPVTGPAVDLGSAYEGVVIWPETEPVTKLVPPMPAIGRAFGQSAQMNPLTIPFYGAYWVLQNRHTEPPPNAIVIRGVPTQRNLRSTNMRPLSMVAHQNLGAVIPLSCCERIDLAITNTDRYPSSVAIELLLVNTTARSTSLSLGLQDVKSTPFWRPTSAVQVQEELLRFTVPSAGLISEFDQISARFHLGKVRADKAARIAIERFVLVPRGR